MNVGDFIYSVYNGILRFGTITEKKLQPGSSCLEWAHFRVDWHDDGQFTRMVRESDNRYLRKKTWWRIDKLHAIDNHHLARSLHEHQNHRINSKTIDPTNIPVC